MLVDTHAHLDFPDFDNDRNEVIERLTAQDMAVVNVGSDFQASKRAFDLSKNYPNIFSALGFHPHDASDFSKDFIEAYREMAKSEKVVAIGEIGLDYYRNLSPKEKQKEVFLQMLGFAKENKLPVVIHSREADDEVYQILKSEMPLRGVVHCFSSTREYLDKIINLGFYVSFTANITYKKADNLRELAKVVAKERLLLETDCPFLAPQEFRGQRNEPIYLKSLAECLSKLRNEPFDEIAQYTTQNAKDLFGLKI